VGAGAEPCKAPPKNNNNPKKKKKENLQPLPLHPNPARLDQRKETSKDQISEKAQGGRTTTPTPQSEKPRQTNRTSKSHRPSEQHMYL
jgi:hypothetical protein